MLYPTQNNRFSIEWRVQQQNPQRKEKFTYKNILQQIVLAGMHFLNGKMFKVSAKTMGGTVSPTKHIAE